MITPNHLGVDEDLARRIIVLARSIAPCIDSFAEDSEDFKNAAAILRGVAAEVMARGSRSVQSQRVGPAQVTYVVTGSSFSDDDRAALRALCASATLPGLPVGSFPESGTVGRVWPEGPYRDVSAR